MNSGELKGGGGCRGSKCAYFDPFFKFGHRECDTVCM